MLNLRSSARSAPSRFFFCFVILCLLLSVGQRASAVGELGGSIGGFVTIKGTKDGLASVPISAASKQLIGGAQQVITNDDGSYSFVNLPPGVYELQISMEGFAPIKQVGIRVNAGQRSSVDIELELGGSEATQQTTKIIE